MPRITLPMLLLALALPCAALLPHPALARPPHTQTRWSMAIAPTPVRYVRPPRRLDGLVDAATQILLAQRLARQRVIVIVPCCERAPVDSWR